MSRWTHPRNDGWSNVDYQLLEDPESNARVSALLNEVCHVFRHHADGHWRSHYKDHYARLIGDEIARYPGLTHRLLRTGERVIQMVTYRAIELRELAMGEQGMDGPSDPGNSSPKGT